MSPNAREDRRPENIETSSPRIDAAFSDFQQLETIGAGGNADVTKVTYDGEGPDVCAVKQPRMNGTLDRQSIEEFETEAETWAKIDDHEHIVGVLDYGGQPFSWIALEYIDGGSLEERLGEMEPAHALWVGVCVARAVRHAHRRGIAHLDLKPENVLFETTEPDVWDVPKVTDWGLAKMLLDYSQSVQGLSPQYAAPEQFDADTYGPPDDYTDIYATGAVVYAALVGEPPFSGAAAAVMCDILSEEPTPPSECVDGLPEGTDEVLMRALAKDKEDRYESILDFRRELENLIETSLDSASSVKESATTTEAQVFEDSVGTATRSGSDKSDSPQKGTTGRASGISRSNTGFTGSTEQSSAEKHNDTGWTADGYSLHTFGSLVLGIGGYNLLGGLNDSLGGFLLLIGTCASLYYWNKDMITIKTNGEIEWSPRRYLYFIGLMIFGFLPLSPLYYFYKRWKVIGLLWKD